MIRNTDYYNSNTVIKEMNVLSNILYYCNILYILYYCNKGLAMYTIAVLTRVRLQMPLPLLETEYDKLIHVHKGIHSRIHPD